MIILITSHHITVESTRDIASSRIHRKHLHKVDDADYEEVDDSGYEEVDDDGYDDLGDDDEDVDDHGYGNLGADYEEVDDDGYDKQPWCQPDCHGRDQRSSP